MFHCCQPFQLIDQLDSFTFSITNSLMVNNEAITMKEISFSWLINFCLVFHSSEMFITIKSTLIAQSIETFLSILFEQTVWWAKCFFSFPMKNGLKDWKDIDGHSRTYLRIKMSYMMILSNLEVRLGSNDEMFGWIVTS